MKEEKRVIVLAESECGILIHCLNDKRTELLQREKDTEAVDEVLLKIIDAPTKKFRWEKEYAER